MYYMHSRACFKFCDQSRHKKSYQVDLVVMPVKLYCNAKWNIFSAIDSLKLSAYDEKIYNLTANSNTESARSTIGMRS